MTLAETILALFPCSDAATWLRALPADVTPEQVWCDCGRGDWMLWLCDRIGIERVLLVRSACQIARSVLHLVPTGEDRPRLAIEAAEAWCDAPSAAAAASASASASAAESAESAAYTAETAAESAAYTAYTAETAAESAAAWAAYTAETAETAAWAATWVSVASASVAVVASVEEARVASLRASGDIVRSIVPWALVEAALVRL